MKKHRFYTIEEIKGMSEEEVKALNRRAIRNLALVMGIKWSIILGISWLGRKLYEDLNHEEE